jgi:hypothetical protein
MTFLALTAILGSMMLGPCDGLHTSRLARRGRRAAVFRRFGGGSSEGSPAYVAPDHCRLPRLPDGRQVIVLQRPEAGLGGRLWSTALVLAKYLAASPPELWPPAPGVGAGVGVSFVGGRRVIELGCGHGGVGLFAAGLRAASVIQYLHTASVVIIHLAQSLAALVHAPTAGL